jgi:hypothetical protein
VFAFVWRTAIQKGLLGGNRTWMTIFAVIGAAKVVRRISGSVPDTVFHTELKPGEALTITHLTTTFEDDTA